MEVDTTNKANKYANLISNWPVSTAEPSVNNWIRREVETFEDDSEGSWWNIFN